MTALAPALMRMRMRAGLRLRLRLLPDNGVVTAGNVLLGGPPDTSLVDLLGLPERATRIVRGRCIGMVFQEPGMSLNPVMRDGDQIIEAI